MRTRSIATLAVGLVYWQLVCLWFGVSEPWDAARGFWLGAYPLSLLLAGAIGLWFSNHAWVAGLVFIFALFPVVMINNGVGSLFIVGLAIMIVLAIPAMIVSGLSAWIRDRVSHV